VTELRDGALLLRPVNEDDVPAIAAACQDPEIPRWTSVSSPYSEDDARKFVATARNASAIVDSPSGELLGTIGFDVPPDGKAHIGYRVNREARGRGTASGTLALLARWALTEGGFARAQRVVQPENRASLCVAESAGFRREGLLRSYVELKGRRPDVLMYSLLSEDL
jgi:ribosomal-protein-alanine N-acetyltransferase